MGKSYATPAAFKTSLEARLRTVPAERGMPMNTVRLKLVIERLLARLFATPNPPWLLKGGYAMHHAYTRPWTDRVNMRSKDLVDLVLLIETGGVKPAEVAKAVRATFARRNTHAIPLELPDPPAIWANEFTAQAAEARLAAATPSAAIQTLRSFWRQVISGL